MKFSHGANLDFSRPWGQHGKKLQFNKFVGFNVKSSAVFVSFLCRLKVYGISLNMKEGDNIDKVKNEPEPLADGTSSMGW